MVRNIVGIDALWGVNQWVQSAYIKLDVVPKLIRSMSQSVSCNKLYTDGKKAYFTSLRVVLFSFS